MENKKENQREETKPTTEEATPAKETVTVRRPALRTSIRAGEFFPFEIQQY